METIDIKVEELEGERLDYYIALNIDKLSRSYVKKLIDDGLVLVNKEKSKSSYILKQGDNIQIHIPEPKKLEAIAEDLPIDIIYEDNDLLIVNKPQDMVVHPAYGNSTGTLVNSLLYNVSNLSSINGLIRPGIIHRLDKDTSGLLIVAKNDVSHRILSKQLRDRNVKRNYKALVHGVIKDDNGTIDAPIGRHPIYRKKMAVTTRNSKTAITHYNVIERFNDYTLLELSLESGRTHQIRVHMNYINHPVVGDPIYSRVNNKFGLKKQMLHSHKVGFIHPSTNEYMEFTKDVPEYFKDILTKLKR